ncbi:MAG: EamA family transporter [Actinomycetes bacterium]
MPNSASANKSKVWLSLWSVYIIWGSTYYGIALAIESMPPLLAMGTRFLAATSILIVVLGAKNGWRSLIIPRAEFLNASLMGGTLLGIAIGSVALGERYVPTGIAALIISALPFWIAIFRTVDGNRPSNLSWLGVVIGFVGVAFLLKPGSVNPLNGASTGLMLFWACMIMIGNIGWSFGSYIAPRFPMPKNPMISTMYQMLTGGLLLVVVGLATGEKFADFFDATRGSWAGWSYLTLVGSIVAYSSYVWLISNAPIGLISTYAYVNPVIAISLGAIFLHEKISISYIFGGAIVVLGVLMVVTNESRSISKN